MRCSRCGGYGRYTIWRDDYKLQVCSKCFEDVTGLRARDVFEGKLDYSRLSDVK